MITFNKIVNKLSKKCWNILFKEDIFDIIDPDKQKKNQNLVDKTIYKLKAQKIIITLKSWVYIFPDEEDLKLNEIDLIEKYYLKLLKKYIRFYVWWDYFIAWNKALEIHLKNFSVPQKINIINRNLNKKIKVWNYEIIFKTVYWNLNWKKTNLYSKLAKFISIKNIDWIEFKIANLELSLLQSALVNDLDEWIDIDLLTKAIKKYSKFFNRDFFEELAKYKFVMSFNRLKEISKNIDPNLSLFFVEIIKKNWWLFIGEWLRKIY